MSTTAHAAVIGDGSEGDPVGLAGKGLGNHRVVIQLDLIGLGIEGQTHICDMAHGNSNGFENHNK